MSFRRQELESFASFGCRLPVGRKLAVSRPGSAFFRRPRGTGIVSRKQARAPRRPRRFPCAHRPPISTRFSGVGAGQGLVSRRDSPTRLGLVASRPIRPQLGHGFRHSRLFPAGVRAGSPRGGAERGANRAPLSRPSQTLAARNLLTFTIVRRSPEHGAGAGWRRGEGGRRVWGLQSARVCVCVSS